VLEKSPVETIVTSGACAVALATTLSVPALVSATPAAAVSVADALATWRTPVPTEA